MPAAEDRKETIAARTTAALREEILSGALAPGTKINLDRLRERFAVSLAPVREAMTRLAAEGLVEAEAQRGYRVAPLTRTNLAEITRLRQELETLALRLAIERGDIDWESRLLAALHRLERSPAEAPAAHDAFHAALTDAAGMPLLAALGSQLRALHSRYWRCLPQTQPLAAADHTAPDHATIAQAALARDAALACRLLAEHIAATGTAARKTLATEPPGAEE